MPGRGSYGPAGKWVYQRAKHIRSKNPDMSESTSFAIATQQAHKVGKSSKKHRTPAGVRAAHAKMRRPMESYKKTAGIRIRGIGARGKKLLGRAKRAPVKQLSNEGVSQLPSMIEQKDNTKTASLVTLSAFFGELEKISQPVTSADSPIEGVDKEAGLREGLRTLLTGRVPLYHGTSTGRARSIVRQGLKPQGKAGISKRLSDALSSTGSGFHEAEKGLAFTTRGKTVAKSYAKQQAGLERVDAVKGRVGKYVAAAEKHAPKRVQEYIKRGRKTLSDTPAIGFAADRMAANALGSIPGRKRLVRMDIPRTRVKAIEGIGQEIHKNPALLEQRRALRARGPKWEQIPAANFIQDVPIKGGVGREFIRGSKEYKKVGLGELKEHGRQILKHPREVGKDVLRSTLGVSHRPSTLLNQGPPIG